MPVNDGGNGQIYLQPEGSGPKFPLQQSIATRPGFPASGPIPQAVLPYWSVGQGVPPATFKPPYGSRYTNTTAAAGQFIEYVYKPTVSGSTTIGVWTGVI